MAALLEEKETVQECALLFATWENNIRILFATKTYMKVRGRNSESRSIIMSLASQAAMSLQPSSLFLPPENKITNYGYSPNSTSFVSPHAELVRGSQPT